MTLTSRGSIAVKRRKKILNFAKGFRGSQKKLFRSANQRVMRAFKYSYFDRKKKKTNFKNIWIRRINGKARLNTLSYNKLIYNLKSYKININKKILAEIIVHDPQTFENLIKLSTP